MKKIYILFLTILFPLSVSANFASAPMYEDQMTTFASINLNEFDVANYQGSGVVVAVVDSGVWLQHPDLEGTTWVNSDEIPQNNIDDDNNGHVDDYYGWNYVDNNNDLITKNNHGTGVAGLIAAQGKGINGIAPKVKIMPLIACDEDGSCSRTAVINSIIYAVQNGANIINLSLGSDGYVGYDSYYDYWVELAYIKNIVVVASAGNGDIESGSGYTIGQNLSFLKASPVSNDKDNINMVLGVGSCQEYNANRSSWSNYGPGVDILAPGENILSTAVPLHNDGYYFKSYSGTSFSAPIVSAAAAVLKSKEPALKNWEIIDRIISPSEFNRLNMHELLTTKPNCEILSANKSSFYVGEKIIVTGKHIYSNIRINLETLGEETSSNQNISSLLNHLDATTFEYNTTSLSPGNYLLGSIECGGKKIPISILEGKNPELTVSTSETQNVIQDNTVSEEKKLVSKIDSTLSNKLQGYILLQVEKNGEGWYVFPSDIKKYYLGRPADAFAIMRKLGLGAKHDFIKAYSIYPSNVLGKILIDVNDNGKAYYIYPKDKKAYYLGRPDDAFAVMRKLGLGITNNDIRKIDVGEIK